MKVSVTVSSGDRVVKRVRIPRSEFIIKMALHLRPDIKGVIKNVLDLNNGHKVCYSTKDYNIEAVQCNLKT